jgi:uncharacterized protein (DUF1501 family)
MTRRKENDHEGKERLGEENLDHNATLQIAKVQLETYRTLVGDAQAQPATQLDNEITALQAKIREPGAADTIRGFWNRVTGWFRTEPGQAEQTTEKKT